MDGALAVPAVPMSAIVDGTTNTIAFVEDAGRVAPGQGSAFAGYSKYADAMDMDPAVGGFINPAGVFAAADTAVTDTGNPNTIATYKDINTGITMTGTHYRSVWRWADPDAVGSGISGPPNLAGKYINNNSTPLGGPPNAGGCPSDNTAGAGCPWSCNNCGPNDEPFSFHVGGINAVLCDGSVRFLSETLDGPTLRRLVTRAEGTNVGSL
jgi:hypothetical protein